MPCGFLMNRGSTLRKFSMSFSLSSFVSSPKPAAIIFVSSNVMLPLMPGLEFSELDRLALRCFLLLRSSLYFLHRLFSWNIPAIADGRLRFLPISNGSDQSAVAMSLAGNGTSGREQRGAGGEEEGEWVVEGRVRDQRICPNLPDRSLILWCGTCG